MGVYCIIVEHGDPARCWERSSLWTWPADRGFSNRACWLFLRCISRFSHRCRWAWLLRCCMRNDNFYLVNTWKGLSCFVIILIVTHGRNWWGNVLLSIDMLASFLSWLTKFSQFLTLRYDEGTQLTISNDHHFSSVCFASRRQDMRSECTDRKWRP